MTPNYTYRIYDTTFSVIANNRGPQPFLSDVTDYPHYSLYRDVLRFLSANGFYVTKDKETKRDYPILSKYHDQGSIVVIPDNGCLQFRSEITNAGFSIKFFQNMVHENPHGNYYDFDIRGKMPYLIRLAFLNTIYKLESLMKFIHAEDTTERYHTNDAVNYVKYDYVKSFHHPQNSMDFDLADTRDEHVESYNCRDRDGRTIRNGDVKYCYGYDGHLIRVTVFHNINNMWWCIANHNTLRNMPAFELFDCEHPAELRRRIAPDRTPANIKRMREELSKMSDKTLERELRRRRKAKRNGVSK